MDDNDTAQLPFIEFKKTVVKIDITKEIYLVVRGSTLEECRKHFDDILGKEKI